MTQGTLADLRIPPGWTWEPLGFLAPRVAQDGFGHLEPLSVYLGAGVVRRADREDNHNVLGADMDKYLHVLPGDLVFNKLRTWQGGLGASKYEGIVSPAYYVLRPGFRLDPRFAHYVLVSTPYLAELTRLSKFMPPSQFDMPWEALKRLPMMLPPVEEQRRIADFLDDQVARIDATTKQLSDGMQSVESRANVAVLNAIGFDPNASKRPEAPGDLVSGSPWPLVRLSLLARLGTGHTPSRSNPDYWQDCRIPWLTTSDIHMFRNGQITRIDDTTFHISDLGIANSAAVVHPAGTIAMSRTASVGFSIEMGTEMATSQDFVTWTCGPRLKPHYLLAMLRATRDDLVRRLAYGSTHKTIYFPDVMSLRIPLPPIDVQDQILGIALESRQWRSDTQAAIARAAALLEERKRALITAAVTGELDVTTAKPIGMGKWVPNVGSGVRAPGAAQVLSGVGGT